jgi:steroid delta-isomerase-like uncharacterized protein
MSSRASSPTRFPEPHGQRLERVVQEGIAPPGSRPFEAGAIGVLDAEAGKEDGTMNLQWARGWLAEFTPAGIEKTMAMYADAVDFEDVTLGHKAATAAGVREFFTSFAKGASQHRFEVTNWAGNESGGAMEWTWTGKHEEDILGVSAKGKQTKVRGISYVGLRNGKIVAERDYWDAATLLRQLGALK